MRLPLSGNPEAEPIKRRLGELSQSPAGTSATPTAAIEQRAAELLARLPRPTELSPAALQRIGEQLVAGPPPLLRPSWPWAVAGTAALGLATLAALVGPRLYGTGRGHDVQPLLQPAHSEAQSAPAPGPPRPVVTPLGSEPAPDVRGVPAKEPAARPPARSPARPPRPSPPTAPALVAPSSAAAAADSEESGLAAESRLLGIALHQLRQERDGAAALRSLQTYQQRFPKGLLLEEAQAAQVDALLLVDHRTEALAFLEKTQFQRLDRGGELRVVRGELRASAGRCREALSDFAAVLAQSAAPPPPLVAERALYGQASCLAQLGDTQGARTRFAQYLSRFPTGRFAAASRSALQNLPATP